jgi:hypothetical protein
MPTPLADRLRTARKRHFVGRTAEQQLFRATLRAEEMPFFIFHLFGPGGVGKSSLLRQFAQIAEELAVPSYLLDGRNIEPSPAAFITALNQAIGLEAADSPFAYFSAHIGRHLLLLDTYEQLELLDHWFRQEFLPQLSDNVLVVFAGRNPPHIAWRTDPGWQALFRVLSLRNLDPVESHSYLSQREIPAEQHAAVFQLTHGHPLALSLVADVINQQPDTSFQSQAPPDVIKTLLERLIQNVPSPAHRAALEACALVRLTTESLLAAMLETADAHALFDWLRALSLTESNAGGVFPHDLVRDILAADLRWRNPDAYARLHRQARLYYAARLPQLRGQEQQLTLIDYIFLHRENPVVQPFFNRLRSSGSTQSYLLDAAHPGDWAELLKMVTQHEGEEAADLAEHWFQRQPESVVVARDTSGRPVGFQLFLALNATSAEDRAADPAITAAWDYLERHAPIRPGERASHIRFWMAAESYQGFSAVQALLGVNTIRHYLTTPSLAFSFFPCADYNFWVPILGYADMYRLPEADFEIGGRRYGVFGHDWRVVPPTAWLDLLAERETATTPPTAPPQPAETLLVLSHPEFAAAVREALQLIHHTDILTVNPLLRSRVVLDEAGAESNSSQRTAVLQSLLTQAVSQLQAAPRQAKLHRALYHTYIQPAPTQEKAAELIDVPYGTFRRHLKEGVQAIIETLWQREIAASQGANPLAAPPTTD